MISAGTCKNIEHVQEKYMFYIIFKPDLLGGCYIGHRRFWAIF